jgi:hypothetical protein
MRSATLYPKVKVAEPLFEAAKRLREKQQRDHAKLVKVSRHANKTK